MARRGVAGHGKTYKPGGESSRLRAIVAARRGVARLGAARRGEVWQGAAGRGWAWQGKGSTRRARFGGLSAFCHENFEIYLLYGPKRNLLTGRDEVVPPATRGRVPLPPAAHHPGTAVQEGRWQLHGAADEL
jgi:hypothetical protein